MTLRQFYWWLNNGRDLEKWCEGKGDLPGASSVPTKPTVNLGI